MSARPQYRTADEVLLCWAVGHRQRAAAPQRFLPFPDPQKEKRGGEPPQETNGQASAALFVTSDRALSVSLHRQGVLLSEPRSFFSFTARLLTGEAGAAS